MVKNLSTSLEINKKTGRELTLKKFLIYDLIWVRIREGEYW